MHNSRFFEFVNIIYSMSPFQKKAISSFLEFQDEEYFNDAKWFSDSIFPLLEDAGVSVDYVVKSYIKMCNDMVLQSVMFKKTGRYTCESSCQAYKDVYASENEMASYMYGLALSQFLWPNHYEIFKFFKQTCCSLKDVSRYLEVGPGHGLYLAKAMECLREATFAAIDISPISLDISENVLRHFVKNKKADFILGDIRNYEGEKYDFISICEVLEHVEDPLSILQKSYDMISASGHVFVTTCANCPAIDHVYLYDSVADIRQCIDVSGFSIVSELALSVGDFPEETWAINGVEVNYAALLSK